MSQLSLFGYNKIFLGAVDIKLKGIGIGNGWMSPLEQGKYASYLYYHGLLDSEQFFILRDIEETLTDMVSRANLTVLLMYKSSSEVKNMGLEY